DGDHLAARWVAARLLEARGRLDEAVKAWKWFIDGHNARQREIARDAAAPLIVGPAAGRYAPALGRGDDLGDSLSAVLPNYDDALKADPHCWQAAWLEGKLFLSGYREGDAHKELTRALQINPEAAEALVTLGQADLQSYRLAAGRAKAERAL